MTRLVIFLNKPILLFLFLIIVVLGIDGGRDFKISALTEGKVRMFMFYAEDCQHCHFIINEFLPKLKEKYGPIIEVKFFEINESENYKLLGEMEKEYGDTNNEIPTIFIDSFVLGSGEEIEENLEDIVRECISKGGCDWPSLPEVITKVKDISPDSSKTIYLAYFSQPGCKECQRIRYLVKNLKQKYGNLQVKEYDLFLEENKELEVALCMKYGIPRKKWLVSPVVFIGEDYLLEDKINNDNLETLLSKHNEIGTTPPWELKGKELSGAQEALTKEFHSWRLFSVIGAGLIDGINPCAFAVIIFFVSWLVFIKQKGKIILVVGLIYIFAVFLAYFLIGMGVLRSVQQLVVFPLISRIIYFLTAIFTLILGFLNLYDYFKAKKGKWKEIKLQLPGLLKKKIHQVTRQFMGQNAKIRTHLISAFAVGFIVSLFEFPCTGQIYLPTIVFVGQRSNPGANALGYLIVYNLMFIVPLVIIFGFTYWGTSVRKFVHILEKNVALVKILTAFFFFGLAGYLIYTVV